jgi:predicted MFS family arabinose efflux permease
MLLPLAAHLAPDRIRGRIIGNVMVGLLVGILIARPVSSLMAASFGWRAIFFLSAGLMALLAIVLRIALPVRHPQQHHHYRDLIMSLIEIPAKTPLLRRRGLYQAAAFGGFSIFWTAVPLLLARRFEYSQRGIALFALIGVSGALAAPIAGRLADRNLIRPGTVCCLGLIAISFLIAAWGGLAGHSVMALLIAAVLLDAGVQANMVLSQRELYALNPAIRSRVNGVFIAIFFTAGALGSSLVSPILEYAGWLGICLVGMGLALAALGYLFTDRSHQPASVRSSDP